MADVAAWVAQIRAAIYGEQVRESIAKSIEAMNEDNIETKQYYDDTIEDVEAATDAATDAAEGAVAIKETVEEKLAHGDFIGATGPQGEAATVAVGSVTTGQPGTAVQVVNSGTNTDAVLDFTIPQGATGNVDNMDTVAITFEPDTTDQNIASGMTLSGLFGRLQGLIGSIRTALSSHQTSIDSLNGNIIKVVEAVSLGSISFNAAGAASATVNMSSSIPAGYKLGAVIPRSTGSYAVYFYECRLSGTNSIYVNLFRSTGSIASITPSVALLCVPA